MTAGTQEAPDSPTGAENYAYQREIVSATTPPPTEAAPPPPTTTTTAVETILPVPHVAIVVDNNNDHDKHSNAGNGRTPGGLEEPHAVTIAPLEHEKPATAENGPSPKQTTTTTPHSNTIAAYVGGGGGGDADSDAEDDGDFVAPISDIAMVAYVAAISFAISMLFVTVSLVAQNTAWLYGLLAVAGAAVAALLVKPGWRWFYIAHVTRSRDLKGLFGYLRLLLLAKRYERKNLTIADIFAQHVAREPDRPALVCEDGQAWSFRQLHEHSVRVANVFRGHGYRRGDVVGLLLENRPEFVATWLGLSQLGVVTPLLNTNLRAASLLHSITVSRCAALIYGEAFVKALDSIAGELPASVALYQFNERPRLAVRPLANDLAGLLERAPKDKLHGQEETVQHHDKLLYIFTSGTTGLPKAAVITHSRYLFIAAGIHYTLGFRDRDVFYTPLPLYHTAGGIMSVGQALIFGSTVAIRRKFSASGYFADCVRHGATVSQYIGEMARYILATPPSPNDRTHRIRLVFGNGLRPQIWPRFVSRFGIAQVGEFYGATEGNANIINNDNTVGAIGFVSRVMPHIYPIAIVRADPATGEPIRGRDGLCQRCPPNEPGVFVGKIVEGNPARAFLGYVDTAASEKKVVRDVFARGDAAFLSGDLVVSDERGYLYFHDRTGDTFRWKGENVSTSEVEAHVSNVAGYRDCVVYGVLVPGAEGRAGMAAICDPDPEVPLDLVEFSRRLDDVLPRYAKPIFLRLLPRIDLTGTFKLRKVDLQRDGFDPAKVGAEEGSLFYLTPAGQYEALEKEAYERICRQEIKF